MPKSRLSRDHIAHLKMEKPTSDTANLALVTAFAKPKLQLTPRAKWLLKWLGVHPDKMRKAFEKDPAGFFRGLDDASLKAVSARVRELAEKTEAAASENGPQPAG